MRVAAIHGVLHGAEGATPPLPWVTVDRVEGAKLIRAGLAREVTGDGEPESDDDFGPAYGLSVDGTEGDFAVLDALANEPAYAPWFTAFRGEPVTREFSARVEFVDGNAVVTLLVDDEAHGDPIVTALPEASAPEGGEGADADAAKRASEIAEAVDLVEPDGFVKSGPRAGKPTVEAVSAITGFVVTADEVDAAVAAKESGA